MKRFSLVFLLFHPVLFCFAQDHITIHDWVNDYIGDQISFNENGTFPRIKNQIDAGKLVRTEFDEDGDLLLRCEITQIKKDMDTIVVFDELGREQYAWMKGFEDVPDGAFVSFHKNGSLHISGQFANGKKTGYWQEHYPSGQVKKTESYNATGLREGTFSSYFQNGKTNISGFYQLVQDTARYIIMNPVTYEEEPFTSISEKSVKQGTWFYYNEAGELLKKEKY